MTIGVAFWPESIDRQMKVTYLIVAFLELTVVVSLPSSYAAEFREKPAPAAVIYSSPTKPPKKLEPIRRMLIKRMKASREELRDALPLYQDRLRAQRADVEVKKKLDEQNLVSKVDLDNSQQVLANAEMDTERVRHWIAEDDLALALADEHRSGARAVAKLAPGTYGERAAFIHYNGVTPWSPALIAKVAEFFKARFGKELPVSAIGQSSTHDRLGYDHRDAVDVGVSPQSREGRDLIVYLCKARIPFLAFRGKIPGVSTGPHIHIGLPSPRLQLMEAKQRGIESVEAVETHQGG